MLLLTGVPGIGKTTAIRRVAEHLAGRRLRGFYTEEIREHGRRQGFGLATFAGRTFAMAHVDFPQTYRVAGYGVDVAVIDQAAAEALRVDDRVDVYLLDEIGKMECLSSKFVLAVRALLDSDKPVVATIARRGGGLIEEVKRRPDAELWELTRVNRDAIPQKVVAWLRDR